MTAITKTHRVLFAGAVALAAGPTASEGATVRVATAATSIDAGASQNVRVSRASHDEAIGRLCGGAFDVVTGPRPMSHAERSACAVAGRPAFEVPIGYEALVVVAEDAPWMDAITTSEIARAFGRSASGERTRASDLRAGWPDTPITLAAEARVEGRLAVEDTAPLAGGVRDDVTRVASAAGLAPRPSEALIAILRYDARAALPATLRAVPVVEDAQGATPIAPSPRTLQRHEYRALARLAYAHATAPTATRPAVLAVLTRLIDAPTDLVAVSDEARAFAHAQLAVRAHGR